jgi:hypothetical protein
MTDNSIEKEIEANNRRKEARDQAEEDDGTLVDAAEEAIAPITNVLGRVNDIDQDDLERRREANDEDQRGS